MLGLDGCGLLGLQPHPQDLLNPQRPTPRPQAPGTPGDPISLVHQPAGHKHGLWQGPRQPAARNGSRRCCSCLYVQSRLVCAGWPEAPQLRTTDRVISTTEIRSHTVLQAGGPRLRGQQTWFFQGLSPWLLDGHLLPGSSHGQPSVHVCVPISPSCEVTGPAGLGPVCMTSCYLNHLF